MLLSAGCYSWLLIGCFTVFFTRSSSSETTVATDCLSYRTGTLGKYIYPMPELAEGMTSFNFSVKVMKYAYIVLSPVAQDTTDQYEIAIGNSEKANTAAIRRCQKCEDRNSATTQYRLLEFNEFKQFWITFKSGTIQIGRYNETSFISWTDQYPLDVRFIGLATGMRLPGDFIFCDLNFDTSLVDVPIEGLLVLCGLFLPATLMIIRMYLKQLRKKMKRSNDEEDTDSFDDFYTVGIENPTVLQPDPDPPSYEKCMEDGEERLRSVDEGASTSCNIVESESPPSYEAAMSNCLFDMNCDAQSGQQKCNIISMWDSASTGNESADDLETFV